MSDRWPAVEPRPFGKKQTEAWQGVPDNETGTLTAIDLILAHSEQVTVRIFNVIAFSTGFSFECKCKFADPGLTRMASLRNREYYESLHPERTFRIGLQLPEGTRVTSLDGDAGALAEATIASGPRLKWIWQSGGHYLWWVYPLPSRGAVTFACEWPIAGIRLSTVDIDATLILEAADRSARLW